MTITKISRWLYVITLILYVTNCAYFSQKSTLKEESARQKIYPENYLANCVIKIVAPELKQSFRCTLELNANNFRLKIFAPFKGLVWLSHLDNQFLTIHDYLNKRFETIDSKQISSSYYFPLEITALRALLFGAPKLAPNKFLVTWHKGWPHTWQETTKQLTFTIGRWQKNQDAYYPYDIAMSKTEGISWKLSISRLKFPDDLPIDYPYVKQSR